METIYNDILQTIPLVTVLLSENTTSAEDITSASYILNSAKCMLSMAYKTLQEIQNKSLLEITLSESKCILFASFLYNFDTSVSKYVMYCKGFEPIETYLTLKLMKLDYALPSESWQLIPFFVNLVQRISLYNIKKITGKKESLFTPSTPRITNIFDIDENLINKAKKNNSIVDTLFVERSNVQKACIRNFHLLEQYTVLSKCFKTNINNIDEILLHFHEEGFVMKK